MDYHKSKCDTTGQNSVLEGLIQGMRMDEAKQSSFVEIILKQIWGGDCVEFNRFCNSFHCLGFGEKESYVLFEGENDLKRRAEVGQIKTSMPKALPFS